MDRAPGNVESHPPGSVPAVLMDLRARAGNVSYGEIARRIGVARRTRGIPDTQSRVGRTTVYATMQGERTRHNEALILEIAVVLDADPSSLDALRALIRSTPVVASADQPATSQPAELVTTAAAERPLDRALRPRFIAVMFPICVAVNLGGGQLSTHLHLQLYLDMIGTAIAAVLLGPWWGSAVGVSTIVILAPVSGWDMLAFAAVDVAGALVWGYGVHRYGMGRTIPRFFVLNLIAGVVCTLVAAPILILLYHGEYMAGSGSWTVTRTLLELSKHLWFSVYGSNILTSLPDKMISGLIALVVAESLPGHAVLEPGHTRTASRLMRAAQIAE